MAIPDDVIASLRQALDHAVFASDIARDKFYSGNAPLLGKSLPETQSILEISQKEQEEIERLTNALKEEQKKVERFLTTSNDNDKNQYANLLYEYALIANSKKDHRSDWNASHHYANACELFQKAHKYSQYPEKKATILIAQAKLYADIAKDKNVSSLLENYRKSPEEIRALYQEALTLAAENQFSDHTLKDKARAGIEKQNDVINNFQPKPPESPIVSELSARFRNLANIKQMKNGDIQIDPRSTWFVGTKYTGTSLVKEVINRWQLTEGKDFIIEKHRAPRTDKFIIQPQHVARWLEALGKNTYTHEKEPADPVQRSEIKSKGESTAPAQHRETKSKGEPAAPAQHREIKSKGSDVSSTSLAPLPNALYTSGRTPPFSDDQVKKIKIPEWEIQKETLKDNKVRFLQQADKNTYLDIDKKARKISSNSTSIETFEVMIKAFQDLHSKDKTRLPMITLSPAVNNESNRDNCKTALKNSGYNPEQIEKIISPLLTPSKSLSATKPAADPSSSQQRAPHRPTR